MAHGLRCERAGEYYVDRATGLLHLIPPGGGALKPTDEVFVSVNTTIVVLNNKVAPPVPPERKLYRVGPNCGPTLRL
jgi:hypothetical protein